MNMDTNALMISLLFGMVGMGMFMYGKKAGRMIALCAGLALMIVPYFIANVMLLLIVCCGFTALPWIIREG